MAVTFLVALISGCSPHAGMLKQAAQLEADKRFEQASEIYLRILERKPTHARALNGLTITAVPALASRMQHFTAAEEAGRLQRAFDIY